jgi:hypothetical protein
LVKQETNTVYLPSPYVKCVMLLFTKIYNICLQRACFFFRLQIDTGCITPYTTLLPWLSDWQFTRVCRSESSYQDVYVLNVVFVADVGNAVLRFPLDDICCDCVAYKRPGRKINLLSVPLETPLTVTFSSDQTRLANREREPPEYPCVSCYSTFTFLGQFLSLHRVCPIRIMSVKNSCISSIVTWEGVPLVSWDAIHRWKE